MTLTIFSSCVCCVSYVGLCCDFKYLWPKIIGGVGITIVVITFSVYTIWMAGGVYLIVTFDKLALFTDVCRNVLAYTVLLGVYLVTVCVVAIVFCVWRLKDVQRRERTTNQTEIINNSSTA